MIDNLTTILCITIFPEKASFSVTFWENHLSSFGNHSIPSRTENRTIIGMVVKGNIVQMFQILSEVKLENLFTYLCCFSCDGTVVSVMYRHCLIFYSVCT